MAYVDWAQPIAGEPEAIAEGVFRAPFIGLRNNDAIGRAGYSDGPEAIVRLVRYGRTIAMVALASQDGGWIVEQIESCP